MKLKVILDKANSRIQQIQGTNNRTSTEVSEEKEVKQIINKNRNRIKEKTDNRISFAHYAQGKNGIPQEKWTDDGLIKRSFTNWSKLRTPSYYKQTALLVIMKN